MVFVLLLGCVQLMLIAVLGEYPIHRGGRSIRTRSEFSR